MITVTVSEAKEKLEELIEKVHSGETVAIVSNGITMALTPTPNFTAYSI
jgi:prevent-host-death family protein